MDNFFEFDRKMQEEKKRLNVLEGYKNNEKLVKTVIPTFQILFKEETGFGVYACEDENEQELLIKGAFVSELVVGQTYLVEGTIVTYKGEKQINVNKIKNVRPINKKGIIAYLQTLKGLKSKAETIYEVFGDKSIEVLMEDPIQVANRIVGIGKKSVMNWKEQLDKMKDSQHTISTLLGYGLSMQQARKLYEQYKEEIVMRIEENPYFLALEVRGYGFEKCDRIAREIGFNPKSKFRVQEGIMHVLQKASTEGHCFLPLDVLIDKCIDLLTIRLTSQEMNQLVAQYRDKNEFVYSMGELTYNILYNDLRGQLDRYKREKNPKKKEMLRYVVVPFDIEDVGDQLQEISMQRRIIYDDNRVYLRYLYEDEQRVAERVRLLANTSQFTRSIDLETELDTFLKEKKITLEERQREAVLEFAKEDGGFHILNGSAGCGKTFTLKIILQILQLQFKNNGTKLCVKVFAPTGKASKVATKATGIECVTVHRGLGYNPQTGFTFNEDEPLEANVIVVDESSMLDITLTKHLLNAIQRGTKIIFMGDTKQLPSVGAGNVLHDLIHSGVVKVITLNVVKRQGKQSGIIRNANKIINGEIVETCEDTKDAYVVNRQTTEGAQKAILQSIENILKFDGYTFEDVQVLCPQRTGLMGTYMLNYLIQQAFNLDTDGIKVLNRKFQVTIDPRKGVEMLELFFKKGDKVIHIKNNYDMEWYEKGHFADYIKDDKTIGITNGECGVIEDIIKMKDKNGDEINRIIVRYENKYVFYDDNFDELDHAFALTIHKSQGSQWRAVILPIMKQNYQMLDNNLFYTGYTRAELFNVVIGQVEAIAHAVKTYKSRERYTHLDESIKQEKQVA
ncbi:AAA family ATPase (plasmid) [Aneurinibacillus sp. Ricciae_BoGa-3]|uniref:AAA family ATPase n=1 Tax=Aneurinibacillus sp. Ricciae_BoGa-3 TaxID=3022697 RepID=UPI0023413554|nr:AAA family ATPase [Aneurinibacillus sp. Ricciae_BoGa-3]WCK57569.1 AAA family ATPase [Aneurinibacillus sp. Ricciae_BoGa-3]